MKRSIVLSAIAAVAVLAPALASAHPVRHQHMRAAPVTRLAPSAYRYGSSYGGPDPYGVYFGGQQIGRDPDPNVRQQLLYDWLYEHS